jgi:hypothetical protein
MKVLAVDVGLVNCSYCVVDASCACLPVLERLHELFDAGSLDVAHLDSVKLGANKNAAAAATFDNVISFLQAHAASFSEVDAVVIETQMSARMKAIAAAFYTAARCLFPQAAVLFQSATAKLNFADIAAYCEGAASGTYAQRKKTSVAVAKKLLAAKVRPEVRQTFLKAKKKDDLSDALLHALAALCAHGKPPKAKAKRRAQPSVVGAST